VSDELRALAPGWGRWPGHSQKGSQMLLPRLEQIFTFPFMCCNTVDGCEILHQLKTMVYPMILFGFQPSKVMQDFATIHSMFQPIPTIKNGHDITTENWNCSPWMQKACAQCAWATKSEVIWRAGQGK